MKPKKIDYSSSFIKGLKKVPKDQVENMERKEAIFRKNPFDPRLKTHSLKGQLKGFYSFSISYHWRIVFHYENDSFIIFDYIGTHAVYK